MKIKLKLKHRHAPILHEFLSHVSFPGIPDKEEKARKSIFEQLYMKAAKKSLKAQIAPTDKDLDLELWYHEAVELEKRLAGGWHFVWGSYQDNAMKAMWAQLNQKLA